MCKGSGYQQQQQYIKRLGNSYGLDVGLCLWRELAQHHYEVCVHGNGKVCSVHGINKNDPLLVIIREGVSNSCFIPAV